MSERVGFIGLGTMGGPMATNLAKAGKAPVVYDTSAAARAALAKHAGVTVAKSAADLAAQVGVLFTCLPNDAIVREVYLGAGGIVRNGVAHGGPIGRASHAQVVVAKVVGNHLAQVGIVIDYQDVSGDTHAWRIGSLSCSQPSTTGKISIATCGAGLVSI